MEDSFENSEQGLTYGEETSRIILRIPVVHLMRWRQHKALWMKRLLPLEKASMSMLLGLLLLWFVLHLLFLIYIYIFFSSLPYTFHLQVLPRLAFQIEAEIDLSLDLSFLDQTTSTPNP